MLARSHRLLVETDLSEQVSKYSRTVSIPPLCGILGTTQPHQKKVLLRHQGCYQFHLFCKESLWYFLIYEECLEPHILNGNPNMLKYSRLLYCY